MLNPKHRLFAVLMLMMIQFAGFSQAQKSYRHSIITPTDTLIRFDTLSIVPGTFLLISANGDTIPGKLYTLTPWNATLLFHPELLLRSDTAYVAIYRLFPEPLYPEYFDRRLQPEPELRRQSDLSYLYGPGDDRSREGEGFFSFGDLNRSGSISRSVSIGNNQDAVLNSTMNLQLSGEIAPGIEIVAAITDNTMPMQPDGSSQQLREFDKVYIKARSKNWELAAGDIEMQNAPGRFMMFNKRGQGLMYSGTIAVGKDKQWLLTTRVSGSVAKGKFHTNNFSGIEGSQGPYKLTGASNELYIMVLAGTEKVYLDGKLLTRGANNDYIIDYNTAQITFTPQRAVTREMRFTITFEYAERYYNRSLIYLHQGASNGRVSIQVQYYMEQDIRSQPISQEQLLEGNRELLRQIGDNQSLAVVPNVREVPFSNSEVLYKKTDTLVGATLYTGIYVYSTNPDSALYRLGFSFTGQGNGNYVQATSAANGRVFVWVAPEGGIPQGDHEPVIQLVTPKRQQMLSLGSTLQATPALSLFAEAALSGLDLNTFSTVNDGDNQGMAFTTGFRRQKPVISNDTSHWQFTAEGFYRFVHKRFTVVERFREREFERDWNITTADKNDEHYGKVLLSLTNRKNMAGSYSFEPLVHGSDDYALRHSLALDATPGKWRLTGNGSLTSNMNKYLPVSFLRHNIILERKLSRFTIGLLQEGEDNRQHLPGNDTLFASSFAFQRWQGSIEHADSTRLRTSLRVGQRYDRKPLNFGFATASRADEVMAGVASGRSGDHRLDINIGYRKLTIADTLQGNDAEESLIGRGEYTHKLLKGVVRGSVFYEFGSGLEYKKEFTYLEVAPGQGVYTWKDYNGDSIKQLDEFEVAVFQDEASYIRVFTPTNEYERVYTMQYNQSLTIDPAAAVNRDKRLGRILARFSDQGHYRVEQKVGGRNILAALDPFFINLSNPALISLTYALRNTLFFNRSSTRYSLEYTTQRSASRMLLVNGFEERAVMQHQMRLRWNLSRSFIIRGEGTTGNRDRASEFFSTTDYNINMKGSSIELQYQPGTKYRVGGKYSFSDKKNSGTGNEHALLHRFTTEFRHSTPMKGSLQAQAEYINIRYNSTDQSSIAFEMLEGLRTGQNYTWTIAYLRILANNMQVNIQYTGRKSPGTPVVHVGTVQVRAFF